MKKLFTLTFFLLISQVSNAGTKKDSVTLRPNAQTGYDAFIVSDGGVDTASTCILAAVWTIGGSQAVWRDYFRFDLSSIPDTAIIDSAFLSLYADTASLYGYTGTPTFGTANAGTIHRVTAPWSRSTIKWSNQPAFSSNDTIRLPQSVTGKDNYLKRSVTKMIQKMVDSGNFGMVLKHNQEMTYYNSLIFHSPRSADSMKRPLLKIYYHYKVKDTVQDTSVYVINTRHSVAPVNIFPNPTAGKCSVTLTKNNGEQISFVLLDVTGKVIFNQDYNTLSSIVNISLDLSNKPAGMYFLKVFLDKKEIAYQKLTKH